jgi:hypothetical protein
MKRMITGTHGQWIRSACTAGILLTVLIAMSSSVRTGASESGESGARRISVSTALSAVTLIMGSLLMMHDTKRRARIALERELHPGAIAHY